MKTLPYVLLSLLVVGCTDAPTVSVSPPPDAGAAPAPTQPPARQQTVPATPVPSRSLAPTPAPTPTATPSPTPRPSPTPYSITLPTPKPTATATPLMTTEPVTLSGTGAGKTRSFPLAQEDVTFQLSHTGKNNFVVWLLSPSGRRFMLLANEVGNFSGTKTVPIEHAGDFSLLVEYGETWTIDVGPAD